MLTQRSYIIVEALPTINQVELINKREFAKVALDENSNTYIVYVATLVATKADSIKFHPSQASQLVVLQWSKTSTKILAKYTDYADIFLFHLAMEFPENSNINEHTIELIEGKQPLYGSIYALNLVELEIFKAYIKTHLKTRFIWLFKSPAGAPIFFDKNPEDSFYLCIDY